MDVPTRDPIDRYVATHLSKLKNIWNELTLEIAKDKKELPEIKKYFSFRSKCERTIVNLTCEFMRL